MSAHDLNTIVPCVYFIRFGDFGPIKIGKTSHGAMIRLAMLQSGSPVELRLLATIDDPDEGFSEESLHERFAHLRIRGEWFLSTLELTDFIAKHAAPHEKSARKIRPLIQPFRFDADDLFPDELAGSVPEHQEELKRYVETKVIPWATEKKPVASKKGRRNRRACK